MTTAEERPIPTEAQLDLLRAAVLPGPEAARSWQRWRARGIEVAAVDEASGRLYSQLWANRAEAGLDGDVGLLKGVYRQALAHNAVVVTAGLRVVRALEDAGIDVVLMKGAAMLAVSGRGLGLRRIEDVDVLVREADARRAVEVLSDLDGGRSRAAYEPPYGVYHSWPWTDLDGHQVDLHWWATKLAGDDGVVLDTARPATLLGERVLVPSPTELLCMSIAHGFQGVVASPLRWAADATLVLQREGDAVDWSALLARARSRPGLLLPLRDGLTFLRERLGADVPPHVLAELRALPAPWRSRSYHRVVLGEPPVGATLVRSLEQHRARRLHDPAGTPRTVAGHLAEATGTGSVPRLVSRQLARVVRRAVPTR